METQFGMKVTVYASWKYRLRGWPMIEVYNNVTEVHYRYPRGEFQSDSVAFESNIHGTGCTVALEVIDSFEVVPADRIEDNF